jgi:uncharacterized protein
VNISENEPIAVSTVSAIRNGDVDALKLLLRDNPTLATVCITDSCGVSRSLLHIATDWPGHFPNVKATINTLVSAGADVNARVKNPNRKLSAETPLHWAASSDDVMAIDALLDGGADIEIPGAVFTNGAPMSDAVVFAQYNAARRLLDRGARTTFWQSAALGLLDHVKESCESPSPPEKVELTHAFWHACRGGQLETARFLLERGADLNWIGWGNYTPLRAAQDSGNEDLVSWLRNTGARLAEELDPNRPS